VGVLPLFLHKEAGLGLRLRSEKATPNNAHSCKAAQNWPLRIMWRSTSSATEETASSHWIWPSRIVEEPGTQGRPHLKSPPAFRGGAPAGSGGIPKVQDAVIPPSFIGILRQPSLQLHAR